MATAGRRPGVAGLGIAALLIGSAMAPPPAGAADESTVVLHGTTHGAITGDLDGDGVREVIRIVDDVGHVRIDAWQYEADGWALIGSTPLLHPNGAGEGSVAVDLERDGVALLAWRVEGRERVLALAARPSVDSSAAFSPQLCCVSISEVRREGDSIATTPVVGESGLIGASEIRVADLDADGTEELILSQWAEAAPGLQILTWNGAAFEAVLEREMPNSSYVWVGESDGIVGDDVLLGPAGDGQFERIAWAEGELRSEVADLGLNVSSDGWIAGITGGRVVSVNSDSIRVLSWPRGQGATEVAGFRTSRYPSVYVIGRGSGAVVAAFEGGGPFFASEDQTLGLYDLALRPIGSVEAGAAATALWDVADRNQQIFGFDRPLLPYMGPLPNGWTDGRDGLVANGVLILADGVDGFEAQPMASLAGLQPIGLAGPGAGWVALSDGFFSVSPQQAYLWPGPMPGAGRFTLTRVENLLGSDDDAIAASVELHGAVEIEFEAVDSAPEIEGVRPLVAKGDGFEAVVSAPAGSHVVLVNGYRISHLDVDDEPLVVEVEARRGRQQNRNQPLEVTIAVMTPLGRLSTFSWEGLFVGELPELTVNASTHPFELAATVEGQATPGTTVAVNGHPIDTDAAGRFAMTVDAPIWPSTVTVVARDLLGYEARDLVEVVGIVDYRGLPWVALVGAATIVAGAWLYIRQPKLQAAALRPSLVSDARLEEIELDPAEADASRGVS